MWNRVLLIEHLKISNGSDCQTILVLYVDVFVYKACPKGCVTSGLCNLWQIFESINFDLHFFPTERRVFLVFCILLEEIKGDGLNVQIF